jgi:hypothetical protein
MITQPAHALRRTQFRKSGITPVDIDPEAGRDLHGGR